MPSRTEAAAATRDALVSAASELLDEGGPDAVTLRAVGARAGVSRGAPYGHFDDKRGLLSQLAIDAWNALADEVAALRANPDLTPQERLERALLALVGLCRRRPHLYGLMFSTPADNAEAVAASDRLQGQFMAVVSDVVGQPRALARGALLMASAHGIAALERSGHLAPEKWLVSGDELIRTLVTMVAGGE